MPESVVVTGLGLICAAGNDVETAWQNVRQGQSGVNTITLFDASRSTSQIAAEVKNFALGDLAKIKDIARSSRFVQLAATAAQEALADAGLSQVPSPERSGCAIGVGIGAIGEVEETALLMGERGPQKVRPMFIPRVIPNMAAGIVANTFGLKGPNTCVSTACTSGTHAIGEAYMFLKSGMADLMVCGGAEAAICELAVAGFGNMKALSRYNSHPQQASRPFDIERDGFVLGEGAGILVIETASHAKRRGAKIIAEISGYGMSADAHHITAPAPEGEGAQRCMQAALNSAGIQARELDYINAHGTSTKYNDLHESMAIEKVFGDHAKNLLVSSTKGVTGHGLGAAGGIEAVLLAKTISSSIVPPTANLTSPDPGCRLNYVPHKEERREIKFGLSNSFGFGGTNGSLLMRSPR